MDNFEIQVGGHQTGNAPKGYAKFDADDYAFYNNYKLHLSTHGAVRFKYEGRVLVVARHILGLTDPFVQIRYIDGNPYNLTRSNLTHILTEDGVKYCRTCKTVKSLNEFGTNRAAKDGLLSICKPCAAEHRYTDEYKDKHKFNEIKRKYNLTKEQYLGMLEAQGGGCAVCGQTYDLAVDHDHACCSGKGSCGKCVRAILCRHCNAVLGYSRENPDLLRKIADYLQERQ